MLFRSFALWARMTPRPRLHLYGVNKAKLAPLLAVMGDHVGQVAGHTQGLKHVYRAATFAITSQNVDTRSVREAMACGCPVVCIRDPNLNGYFHDFQGGIDADRARVRRHAETLFNPRVTAEQFEGVLGGLA